MESLGKAPLSRQAAELVRYFFSGVSATAVHYAVLSFNLDVLHFSSAGVANLLAAIVGITVSFLGNRYFVFKKFSENICRQSMKFFFLYSSIALIHAVVLFVWTDLFKFDYRIGFIVATSLQVSIGYLGNKVLVFRI